jgi:CubicO group peptidase (beta-lactamase class C family)
MDQVVQSYVNAKQFMGSVLVARGEDVLFSKSYGSANLEWNIPNTPATKFRIGSMTKQFTGRIDSSALGTRQVKGRRTG